MRKLENIQKLQGIIGRLNYLGAGTRPDILYATNYLSRRIVDADIEDFTKAKNVLRYLSKTKSMGIIIKGLKEKDNEILCYVDASFANTKERKSIYGYIIFINQTPVHFKCKKQPMITLSTTEAEFVGISFAIQEVKWIMNFLEELKN